MKAGATGADDFTHPLTDLYFQNHAVFYPSTANAGSLDCYRAHVVTHASRQIIIAKWQPDKSDGLMFWQVWIEDRDICRIKYIEQLNALLLGMGAKLMYHKKSEA